MIDARQQIIVQPFDEKLAFVLENRAHRQKIFFPRLFVAEQNADQRVVELQAGVTVKTVGKT